MQNPPTTLILVNPQLGENIGMCARAMLNCGFTKLRLVAPRDGWPSESALKASAGADALLEQATVYETVADAIADCTVVYATTARQRALNKPVIELPALPTHRVAHPQEHIGILFGAERSGLENEAIALADYVLTIPLNPDFSSLNLAQAVLLVCYTLRNNVPVTAVDAGLEPLADKAQLLHFLGRLEGSLIEKGFLYPEEKRPLMMRNIQTLFTRAQLSTQEVQTLEGILTALRR
jgi:tRNA/rRNA methyltransferase